MTAPRLPRALRHRAAVVALNVPAPVVCLCSHARVLHSRGEGGCWISVCGCSSFRAKP